MKKLMHILAFIALMGAGCSKGVDKPNPTPTPDPDPTLANLTVNPETTFYKDQAIINFVVSNATSVKVTRPDGSTETVNGNSYIATNVLPGQVYTLTAISGTKSASQSVTLQAWTETKSFICKETPQWGMDSSTFWQVNSQGNAIGPVNQGNIDPNRYKFFTNNTGQSWVASTGTTHSFTWSLQSGDTKMETTGDVWDIEYISNTKLVKTQVKPDPFNPTILFKSRVVYTKKG